MAQTLTAIREVGRALGRAERAEALISEISTTRERIRAKARGRIAPRVLVVYGFEPLVVAGPGAFADELLRDVGATNVVDSGGAYVVLPLERALRLSPVFVLDVSDSSAGRERIRALPGLSEARWVRPQSKALLQPGASLGRALEELDALLWP